MYLVQSIKKRRVSVWGRCSSSNRDGMGDEKDAAAAAAATTAERSERGK